MEKIPTLIIIPPVQYSKTTWGGANRFEAFIRSLGWEPKLLILPWGELRELEGVLEQIKTQTRNKIVFGFSLGALYAHLGATQAQHLILGSISPFFLEDVEEGNSRWMISYTKGNATMLADILIGGLEDNQMQRRCDSIVQFYTTATKTIVPNVDHELFHPDYLAAIAKCLEKLNR